MSRVGKKPIEIPQGVKVSIEATRIEVCGKLGKLEQTYSELISINKEENILILKPLEVSKKARSYHGLMRALVQNMILGVETYFQKTLVAEGVGYKFQLEKDRLVLSVGFSHPVFFDIPKELTIKLESSTKILIQGIEKDPIRHLDSYLLNECGKCIAKHFRLEWPNVQLILGDLNDELHWANIRIPFGFLNNFCFPLSDLICKNACKFLKNGMLACFKFEAIASASDDCITCVSIFEDMGQWDDSDIFVLECCSRYFTEPDKKCKKFIIEWLDNCENTVSEEEVLLKKNSKFWAMAENFLVSIVPAGNNEVFVGARALLKKEMYKQFGVCKFDVYDKFAQDLFDFATKQPEYVEMRLMYRPFFLSGVALMLYLEVLKLIFENESVFSDEPQLKAYLVKAIGMVSHQTLPFCHGVHQKFISGMEFSNITKVVTRASKCKNTRKHDDAPGGKTCADRKSVFRVLDWGLSPR
jgi:large subunit ribosomal protein L6